MSGKSLKFIVFCAATGMLCLFLSGCEHLPVKRLDGYSESVGERAADVAHSMVGRPYRYRGAAPTGFDCSGLVHYSYTTAGMKVPRSARELRRHAIEVSLRDIRRGDLVFFDQEGKPYSHVGIYTGNNLFVHSPSTGKKVRSDSLLDPYWRKHLLEARRF